MNTTHPNHPGRHGSLSFRAGRARFIAKLLSSPRIYLSDTFHARLELRARHNLAAALGALS